jgi:sugar phosphate isomerase/epimerase
MSLDSSRIALELWTVRHELAEDLPATLATVAEIGYGAVELVKLEGWPAADLRRVLDANGLQVVSAHVPYVDLRDDLDAVVAYHTALGHKDLVISVIPGDLRQTEDDWRERIDEIEAIAKRCRAAGFRLSYHNHAMEFENYVDGDEVHDVIFRQVAADLLNVQLDTYFVKSMGKDPVAYIERYAGRLPLLHAKEAPIPGSERSNPEVGQGSIDWPAVVAASEEAGVEWVIVEQNCIDRPALDSIAISYRYLVDLLG